MCSVIQQSDDHENDLVMNGNSMDHMADNHDIDVPNMDQMPDSQNIQSELEISQTYEGAPELVRDFELS